MAIDDTGRIIAVGGNRVVRFTADGALDTSFSADGWATDRQCGPVPWCDA